MRERSFVLSEVEAPTIRFNILYDDDDADEWYEDGSSYASIEKRKKRNYEKALKYGISKGNKLV